MTNLRFRRAAAAVAAADNPVLAVGEPGFETDTGRIKVGDGATAWNNLKAQYPLPLGATDGQLFAYSAATDSLVAVNPTGVSEVAAAVNNTGTQIALQINDYGGTTYTMLTGMTITVPPSGGRPVTVEWDGLLLQSAAGSGSMWVALFEGAASLGLSIHHLPIRSGDAVNPSEYLESFHGMFRLGAVTTARTFTLQAMVSRNGSAASPSVSIAPLASAPLIMRALAG